MILCSIKILIKIYLKFVILSIFKKIPTGSWYSGYDVLWCIIFIFFVLSFHFIWNNSNYFANGKTHTLITNMGARSRSVSSDRWVVVFNDIFNLWWYGFSFTLSFVRYASYASAEVSVAWKFRNLKDFDCLFCRYW